MSRKSYFITWIALIGLVLAASSQAKAAPGRGRNSVSSRHGSVSRGHSSINSHNRSVGSRNRSVGRSRGSLSGGFISIGSRHSGISFRLGFGGSRSRLRTSIVPRLGRIYSHRRPVILPLTRTVVIAQPRPIVVPDPTVTVWITNGNGSMSPVVLTQDGPWYVGPRGERYFGMPTAEQLRPVYGLNCDTVAVAPADVVVYITAANGTSIPVKLIATQDGYIGPKGELYAEMPTEQQLRMIYGK
jgi:hypothetical protein